MSFDAPLAALLIAAPPALAVAISDLRTMRIPNWLTGATFALFLGFVFLVLPAEAVLWRLGGAAIVLACGFGLFLLGVVGGGDAKAAAAFAPLVAPHDAGAALVLLALSALVGLMILSLLRRTALARGGWAVWSARRAFPYGVALSSALLIYLALAAFAV